MSIFNKNWWEKCEKSHEMFYTLSGKPGKSTEFLFKMSQEPCCLLKSVYQADSESDLLIVHYGNELQCK